jgi:ATP-dependent Clp protease protease subunit
VIVMGHYSVPTVVEKTPNGERVVDVYSRLLSDRIVYLGTEIDDDVANVIVAQLLYLESDNPDAEISLYINSPGGSMSAMTAVYDTMQFVRAPVATTCVGQAASAAAILLAAGTTGRRALLPHTRVLLHQPSTGGEGQISDLALQARELLRVREQMEAVLSRHTGQDVATLRRDTDRDKVFTAEQAVAYGLADHIITSRQPALARPA